LARLPEAARPDLETLLAELQALGFASEAWPLLDAAPALANEEPPQAESAVEEIVNDVVTRIERCPLPILVDWVNEEAEWLVAQVLAQRKWSWTDALLEKMRSDKRSRLLKMPREIIMVPGLVSERLLARLADHLEGKAKGVNVMKAADGLGHQDGARTARLRQWLRSFVQRA
jgi:hypothetical protein